MAGKNTQDQAALADTLAMAPDPLATGRLLIACPDARGIVAAVAGFINEHGGNLLDARQHTDPDQGEFFMRAEFDLTGCDLDRTNFAEAWSPIAERCAMKWHIRWSHDTKRTAILVGRQPHCLHDLIWRWQANELDLDIAAIISNHDLARPVAEQAGLTFHHLPIETRHTDGKAKQEVQLRAMIDDLGVDLIVLARYMQILGPALLSGYENRIINIHHSFLPAFAGGDPYRQAYERGVKIIGATSHYVTEVLDDGPIIAQDVTTVTHRDSVEDLKRKGRDLERTVLARAVRAHTDDRVLVSGNKTVVFE